MALEIHVLFDDHGMMEHSPTEIERQKRDKSATVNSDHECLSIDSLMALPTDWRGNLLNCRKCKRLLCDFLSHEMLVLIHTHLREDQIFITAGGFWVEIEANPCVFVRVECNLSYLS